MTPSDSVVSDLQTCLAENQRQFNLLNIYQGVQFDTPATLEQVEETAAIFRVQSPAAILLETQRETVILSNGLLEPIRAQVRNFDILTGRLGLTNFNAVASKFGIRREIRVEPHPAVMAEIVWKDQRFDGYLVDLSMSGAGLCLVAPPTPLPARGEKLQVTFQFREGWVQVDAPVRGLPRGGETPRLSIGFPETFPQRPAILRYIMYRRAEIITEVSTLYQQTYEAKAKLRQVE
jgi:hypothetical protein